MFDAEKRALELALKGERVARYIQTDGSAELVWYIHSSVAFRPNRDCINPVMFSSNGEKFVESWDWVIKTYMDRPHYFMEPQAPVINQKDKLIPMLSIVDDVVQQRKHVRYADIQPWFTKKWRYVFVPEEHSWRGGVFLILPENSPDPEAFMCPYIIQKG